MFKGRKSRLLSLPREERDNTRGNNLFRIILTSKGIKHLNLRENMVRECHQSKDMEVEHIPGITNPRNEGQHPLQKSQRLHNGLSSSVPEVQSQCANTYYLL